MTRGFTATALLILATRAVIAQGQDCALLAGSLKDATLGVRTAEVTAHQLLVGCDQTFEYLFDGAWALSRRIGRDPAAASPRLVDLTHQLLDRAIRLEPSNAAAWYAMGMFLARMGSSRNVAEESLRRAVTLADDRPDSTPPGQLAVVQAERGRLLAGWIDRIRWLKDAQGLHILGEGRCGAWDVACYNAASPTQFNRDLANLPPARANVSEATTKMARLLRAAIALSASPDTAFFLWARQLALAGDWDQLEREATECVIKHELRCLLLRGLALERQGRLAEADSSFRLALIQSHDSDVVAIDQPPSELAAVPDFWRRARPLWLAPINELQLEYWSRAVYARLVFPQSGSRRSRPDSLQRDILRRYGWPQRITVISTSTEDLLAASRDVFVDDIAACAHMTCPVQGSTHVTEAGNVGEAWIVWTYDSIQPSAVFHSRSDQPARPREQRLIGAPVSESVFGDEPISFRSRLAPHEYALPFQRVRFMGEHRDTTILAVYGILPAGIIGIPDQDSVATQLSIFLDAQGFPLVRQDSARNATGATLALSYFVPLGPARYYLALEALDLPAGVAAKGRDSVTVRSWNKRDLQTSDLLVALSAEPKSVGEARQWTDLSIEASRTLVVTQGTPITLVWETYGLTPLPDRTGSYEVALQVRDSAGGRLGLGLLRALGLHRPEQRSTRLSWTSTRSLARDGRALEYVSVQLPGDVTGAFQVEVRIKERSTGRQASSSRWIRVVGP